MGRKGTSRKPSTKSGAGESQAPCSAVASTRKRQSTRPSQPDPAQPPMDDAAARRYGHFVIAVTLIAIDSRHTPSCAASFTCFSDSSRGLILGVGAFVERDHPVMS